MNRAEMSAYNNTGSAHKQHAQYTKCILPQTFGTGLLCLSDSGPVTPALSIEVIAHYIAVNRTNKQPDNSLENHRTKRSSSEIFESATGQSPLVLRFLNFHAFLQSRRFLHSRVRTSDVMT